MIENAQEGPSIALACLDMAGTTVSDDGAVEESFLAALATVGVNAGDPRLPRMLDYVRETMGSSKIAVFEALFPDDDRLPTAANKAFETAYDAIVSRGGVKEMPGAREAIAKLRSNGIRVALLTGFSIPTRDKLIDSLNWQAVADLLVCPQEAGRGRPHPDMVLHAILKLGIDDVSSVAVVGDTAADIKTGLRAGASVVVGVLSGADDAKRLRDAGATALLDGIRELPDFLSCT